MLTINKVYPSFGRGELALPAALPGAEASSPETWVDEYGDSLYRFVLTRVRDASAAEEIVQETFVSALSGNFGGRSSLKTWLFGIARHKVLDHFRRRSREYAAGDMKSAGEHDQDGPDVRGSWHTEPSVMAKDPTDALDAGRVWSVLRSALAKMSPTLADAFVLREIEGMDSDKIAETLGCTTSTLWVRLHRARSQLKKAFEEAGIGLDGVSAAPRPSREVAGVASQVAARVAARQPQGALVAAPVGALARV